MQDTGPHKKELVDFFLKKGLLLSQEFLEKLEDKFFFSEISKLITSDDSNDIVVLGRDIKEILNSGNRQKINWQEMEKIEAISEKKGTKSNVVSVMASQKLPDKKGADLYNVNILHSYKSEPKKREAQDFIEHFNVRYRSIAKILRQRQELQNTISIARLLGKKDREQVSVIGMVKDKQFTKNNNCVLTLEDETGYIKVILSKNKPELFKLANDILLDEVIGISGVNGDKVIFSNNILFPDVPANKEIKRSLDDAHVIFLSDLHVGSKNFLREDFNRFLKWINQDLGNDEQRETASKVKYLFVVGDLVDGCGVYPDQEKELEIKDIKDQYTECADLLSKIPRHIKLVICPGNHDAMRVAEPQLPIYRDFSEPLYNLPNAMMVSNPSLVNIHSSENFPGFDILLYHGYSFDFYVAEVNSIRSRGGYDRAELIMKFLLQKRHLAPSHTSTLYIPDTNEDALVIGKVPDFFVSGHIHKAAAANYRNITMISGSCWQSKTAFQEKMGHKPEPSRVPIVNLNTREIKMLKFGK